jgi:hypothetical protein
MTQPPQGTSMERTASFAVGYNMRMSGAPCQLCVIPRKKEGRKKSTLADNFVQMERSLRSLIRSLRNLVYNESLMTYRFDDIPVRSRLDRFVLFGLTGFIWRCDEISHFIYRLRLLPLTQSIVCVNICVHKISSCVAQS